MHSKKDDMDGDVEQHPPRLETTMEGIDDNVEADADADVDVDVEKPTQQLETTMDEIDDKIDANTDADAVDDNVDVDVEKQTQQLETTMEVIDDADADVDVDVDVDVEKQILQCDKKSSPYAGADIHVDNVNIDAVVDDQSQQCGIDLSKNIETDFINTFDKGYRVSLLAAKQGQACLQPCFAKSA